MKARRTKYVPLKRGYKDQGAYGGESKPVLSRRKDLIRIDTRTIRDKALQAHRQAERSLSKLKDQLKRYHEIDIPGFQTWLHRTFGSLLTRQRELRHAIEEKRAFIAELKSVASRYHLSDIAAYRKLLWRRAFPDRAQAEDRQFEEAERQRQAAQEQSDHAPNDFWADDPAEEDIPGRTEFESIPDDEWDNFSDFFEKMTGFRPPPRHSHQSPPAQKTVKELYRTIVRRLHPDHHGELTEARKALWHEAQAAYRLHDINALYSILARCDAGATGLGDQTPVSLILHLTQQLKKAAQAARRDIRKITRDLAWDYEHRIESPVFVRRVKTELEDIVQDQQWNLNQINRELDRLARLANRPTRPTRHP